MTKYDYESGRLAGVEWGTHLERRRIFELLFEMGVIRDNMVGQEWLVIYTQDGPQDIKRDFLNETETKGESSGNE